mmetsp:Transcript_47382/g.118541  ORF Transcript_47382/g.118541 Transcript_47382/m.118541 type:complete len:287 (+) Transcript_47382:1019-1879(+)
MSCHHNRLASCPQVESVNDIGERVEGVEALLAIPWPRTLSKAKPRHVNGNDPSIQIVRDGLHRCAERSTRSSKAMEAHNTYFDPLLPTRCGFEVVNTAPPSIPKKFRVWKSGLICRHQPASLPRFGDSNPPCDGAECCSCKRLKKAHGLSSSRKEARGSGSTETSKSHGCELLGRRKRLIPDVIFKHNLLTNSIFPPIILIRASRQHPTTTPRIVRGMHGEGCDGVAEGRVVLVTERGEGAARRLVGECEALFVMRCRTGSRRGELHAEAPERRGPNVLLCSRLSR